MKKFFVIISIVAIIGGGVMFVGGMTALGWDFSELDTERYEKKQYSVEGEVNEVRFDVSDSKVIVKKGDAFSLEYYTSEKKVVTVTEDAGVLTVSSPWRWEWSAKQFWPYNWGLADKGYILTIPTSGIKLDVKNNNGSIRVTGLSLSDCTLDTDNSSITVENIQAKSLTAKSANGSINTNKVFVHNNIDLTTSNSSVNVKKTEGKEVRLTTSNGSINMTDLRATDLIKAKTANSSIRFTNSPFITCPVIELETYNGSIKGTVNGVKSEYNITSSTSNGSTNIGNSEGTTDNKLTARSSNGSINISFTVTHLDPFEWSVTPSNEIE